MMADAMDGKIDLIITKSVSRFARNLMDCIVWVEALQNHDPPVGWAADLEGSVLEALLDRSLAVLRDECGLSLDHAA